MLRNLFALAFGVFAMMCVILGLEALVHHTLFPPPADLDWKSPQAVSAYIAAMPASASASILFGWLAGAFVGGFAAAKFAGSYRYWIALVPALFVSAGTLADFGSIPHPAWMMVAGIAIPPLLALLAAWLVERREAQKGLASTR